MNKTEWNKRSFVRSFVLTSVRLFVQKVTNCSLVFFYGLDEEKTEMNRMLGRTRRKEQVYTEVTCSFYLKRK